MPPWRLVALCLLLPLLPVAGSAATHQTAPASREPAKRHQPMAVARPRPLPLPPTPPSPPKQEAQTAAGPAKPERDPNKGTVTGLPVPRYVSLRADVVNLRAGPGARYPIDWVYRRVGMPVEILREFDVWRLVQTPDGEKGWMHEATLTGPAGLLHRRPIADFSGGTAGDRTSRGGAAAGRDRTDQTLRCGCGMVPRAGERLHRLAAAFGDLGRVAGGTDQAVARASSSTSATRAWPEPFLMSTGLRSHASIAPHRSVAMRETLARISARCRVSVGGSRRR